MDRFPLTVALGNAFCNRVREREDLAKNILAGNHLWLQAVRRHGKTSLVMQTLEDIRPRHKQAIHFERVDLLMATDTQAAGRQILNAVGKLATSIPNKNIDAVWERLAGLFQRLKPEIKLTTKGPSMSFALNSGPEEIKEALIRLDELAIEHEVRVVLVLDEFQRLGEVDPGYAIEAGIRHAAEQIKAITLVFLGSNRRLMEQAFTSKGRPLYRHCRSLNLARIAADAYRSHIQIAAMDRWGADLSPEAIEAIISLTERHPYYVNNLCNHLWAEDIAPSLDAVENMWNCVVQEVRYQHEGELLRLTPNQRRMLIALAEEPTSKPSSKEFVFRSGIASGSIENTIIPLLDNDFIARDKDNRLYVVDPAVAEIARSFA